MKKQVLAALTITGLFFAGCAQKINPDEFAPINAPTSKFKPSQKEMNSKAQILIVPFNGGKYSNLDQIATGTTRNLLANDTAVKLVNRKFQSIKKEIELAEEAKKANTNLDEANYLIQGKILAKSTNSVYVPAQRIKTKHGYTYTKPYYRNTACVDGEMVITKLPENYIVKTLNLHDCENYSASTRLSNFDSLLAEATREAVNDKKEILYNLFAKKGYVFEIRKKDDTTILHTTIGSKTGAETGVKVYIYTIKETKVPFSNKTKKEEIKIGTGEISNVVNPDDSWVIVDETTQPVKIGDYVKPHHEKSFFQVFMKKASNLVDVVH